MYEQESYFTYNESEESPIDHDVHFRPGVGADGSETYTPRTVIYDLKGGFGTLRKYNALYELSEDAVTGQGLWYVLTSSRNRMTGSSINQGWPRGCTETTTYLTE